MLAKMLARQEILHVFLDHQVVQPYTAALNCMQPELLAGAGTARTTFEVDTDLKLTNQGWVLKCVEYIIWCDKGSQEMIP